MLFTCYPFIILCISLCYGSLNFYLDEAETQKLLGLDQDFYYVHNGVVNYLATAYSLPVKSDVERVYFSWQNANRTKEISYTIGTWVSDESAVLEPQVDVPLTGVVPYTPSAFSVTFECSGLKTKEVFIEISVNVSSSDPDDSARLLLKRSRTCREGALRKDTNGPIKYKDDYYTIFSLSSSTILYLALGVVCSIIVFVACIITACYMKNKKHYQRTPIPSEAGDRCPTTSIKDSSFISNGEKDYPGAKLLNDTNQLEFCKSTLKQYSEDQINKQTVLHIGTFGCLYEGQLVTKDKNTHSVYIKTVTEAARIDQSECMLQEGSVYSELSHDNLHSVIGVCVQSSRPMLLYPSVEYGNLKHFLKKSKVSDLHTQSMLSTLHLVYIGIQVAKGIQYIHKKKLLHTDIATRNCVVDSQLLVKVGDSALSRDLFPNDYHCLGDNENRPIKWLAYESLVDHVFSMKSDMWSLGVLLWELMTAASQPYVDVDPYEMETYLEEGYRMSQPHHAPDEMFAMMACCWATSPEERPNISQLLTCLQNYYKNISNFV